MTVQSHTRIAELRATRRETTRYHVIIVLRSAATFTAMVLCDLGYLPVWGLLLANVVLYPEI